MEEALARVVWHGDSRERLRAFPTDARESVGFQLDRVQRGMEPRDWKPMPGIGTGVREIRVHAGNEYRVIYLVHMRGEVHVLHAFVKKSQKTRRIDIELGRRRYLELHDTKEKR